MSPVGGSRHYDGAGLGQVLTWTCPSCGAENSGPITQGCQLCGAGKPGQRATEPPPPPPATPPDDERPTYDDRQEAQGDIADYWARKHPDVTIAEAYRAGYLDGLRAARAAAQPPLFNRDQFATTNDGKIGRTIIAALALFRDQVLANGPEEIETGEWLSAVDVTNLIQGIREDLHEAAHV